jgi:PASTA domain
MRVPVCAVAVVLSACSLQASLNGKSVTPIKYGGGGGDPSTAGGASSSGGSADVGPVPTSVSNPSAASVPANTGSGFPLPDLRGKTAAQVGELLKSRGFQIDTVNMTDLMCNDSDDTKMQPQNTVCGQEPAVGVDHGPHLIRLSLTIEHDTYEHGGVGNSNEWRRMPNLVGKSFDVARTILARASLPIDSQFNLVEVVDDKCPAGQVCATSPEGNHRKVLGRRGEIVVGKAGAARPVDDRSGDKPADPNAPKPTPKPDDYF